MAHAVSLGSYVAAAFLLAGLVATLLISATPGSVEAPPAAQPETVGRHRRE
jgi:hypothetical protein